MSFWILTKTGNVLSRTTVSRTPNLKRLDPVMKQKLEEFDLAIKDCLNEDNHVNPNNF
jgi:hypothetical protein